MIVNDSIHGVLQLDTMLYCNQEHKERNLEIMITINLAIATLLTLIGTTIIAVSMNAMRLAHKQGERKSMFMFIGLIALIGMVMLIIGGHDMFTAYDAYVAFIGVLCISGGMIGSIPIIRAANKATAIMSVNNWTQRNIKRNRGVINLGSF